MSYSNGILGWGASETEKIVDTVIIPEPVYFYSNNLIHNNTKNVKFADNQENAVISDPSHFSISNNCCS